MSNNGSLASKQDILSADDLKHEDVQIPEWKNPKHPNGMVVRVRELTATEMGTYQAAMARMEQIGSDLKIELTIARMKETVVAMAIIDGSGNRVFSDAEIAKVGSKSHRVIDRLYDKVMALSSLTPASVEQAVGESEATPSA